MPHAVGTRLDGLASLEDLKGRCVVDVCSGCWHLRTAHGRAIPHDGKRQMVHVHGHGVMTALQAVWVLKNGPQALQELRETARVVYRCCGSHDCVRPGHVAAGHRRDAMRVQARLGVMCTAKHRATAAATGRARQVLTPELRVWMMESSQSAGAVAHAMGVGKGRIDTLRAEARKRARAGGAVPAVASVFELGAKLRAASLERAAA